MKNGIKSFMYVSTEAVLYMNERKIFRNYRKPKVSYLLFILQYSGRNIKGNLVVIILFFEFQRISLLLAICASSSTLILHSTELLISVYAAIACLCMFCTLVILFANILVDTQQRQKNEILALVSIFFFLPNFTCLWIWRQSECTGSVTEPDRCSFTLF